MQRWELLKKLEKLCLIVDSEEQLEDNDTTRSTVKELGVKCPTLKEFLLSTCCSSDSSSTDVHVGNVSGAKGEQRVATRSYYRLFKSIEPSFLTNSYTVNIVVPRIYCRSDAFDEPTSLRTSAPLSSVL